MQLTRDGWNGQARGSRNNISERMKPSKPSLVNVTTQGKDPAAVRTASPEARSVMLVMHGWQSLMLKDPYFSHIDSKCMLNLLTCQKKAQPRVARLTARDGLVPF